MQRLLPLLVLAGCGHIVAKQSPEPDAPPPPADAQPPPADAGPPTTVLVSTVGNDLNDGLTQPVKTLKRGIGIALANGAVTTIVVAPGRYDGANGETFPYTVPAGIKLSGPAGGGAILAGSGGENGLALEMGTIENLELDNFAVAITASGTARLDTIAIFGPAGGCKTGIELDGTAAVTAAKVTTRALAPAILTKDQSTLVLSGSELDGDASCMNSTSIDAESTASTAVTDTVIDGGPQGIVFRVDPPTTSATLTNVTIRNTTVSALGARAVSFTMTGGALTNNAMALSASGGTWSFTGVSITGSRGLAIYLQGTSATALGTLVMRGCTLSRNAAGIDLFDFAGGDLGTVTSPGGNTITDNTDFGLDADGSQGAGLITAVGNTWRPNVQGADANGHYALATVTGPIAFVDGNNFLLGAGWSLER